MVIKYYKIGKFIKNNRKKLQKQDLLNFANFITLFNIKHVVFNAMKISVFETSTCVTDVHIVQTGKTNKTAVS